MPKLTKSTKKPQGDQVARFIEAARALGCDDDPAHFDEALKKVARHKTVLHWSDCAVNNGPALPPGPCTCGGFKADS